MRSLFNAPNEIEGFVFINEAGEKYLLTNNEFSPTDIETIDDDIVSFDLSVQATVDNALAKLNEIKAEIQTAIENFE
jgi:hypothetical protein